MKVIGRCNMHDRNVVAADKLMPVYVTVRHVIAVSKVTEVVLVIVGYGTEFNTGQALEALSPLRTN